MKLSTCLSFSPFFFIPSPLFSFPSKSANSGLGRTVNERTRLFHIGYIAGVEAHVARSRGCERGRYRFWQFGRTATAYFDSSPSFFLLDTYWFFLANEEYTLHARNKACEGGGLDWTIISGLELGKEKRERLFLWACSPWCAQILFGPMTVLGKN